MKNWYKKAQLIPQRGSLGMGEDEYNATVHLKASEYGPNGEWEAVIDAKTSFKYHIEIEHRSWGIKDFHVYFRDALKEMMIITYFDKDGNEIKTEDRPISIDMSKLPVEYVRGDGISVADIDISLTSNLEIDYSRSSITVANGNLV